MRSAKYFAAAGVLAVCASIAQAAAPFTLTAMVRSGDSAAGVAGGTFADFDAPAIAWSAPWVGFRARLNTGGAINSANDDGIWTVDDLDGAFPITPVLTLQAREGSAAGATGLTYGALTPPTYSNDIGPRLGFRDISSGGETIFYVGPGGATNVVARGGTLAPGAGAGVNFTSDGNAFSVPRFHPNQQPRFTFRGNLTGTGVTAANNVGIWSGPPTSLNLIARAGSQVTVQSGPIPPAGLLYGNSFSEPAGSISYAFSASLTGTGTTAANDSAIFNAGSTAVSFILAREGNGAPGLPGGVMYGDLLNVPIAMASSFGNAVYVAPLTGSGVNAGNDSALYNGTTVVAREGIQAAGAPAGVNYDTFVRPLSGDANFGINLTGFLALVSGTGVNTSNDECIFAAPPGSTAVNLMAREGTQAADLPAGVLYDSFLNPQLGGTYLHTTLAFMAALEGSGVDLTNDFALFATLPDGSTACIAREGSLLDLGGGDLRTVASLAIASGDGTGLPRAVNTFDKLAFYASFTDGSSAIMMVELPEPSLGLTLLLPLCGMRRRSRRG